MIPTETQEQRALPLGPSQGRQPALLGAVPTWAAADFERVYRVEKVTIP